METEHIEAFITRLRAGIDALTDQLLEELDQVRGHLLEGRIEQAQAKISAMITSLEESEDEDND